MAKDAVFTMKLEPDLRAAFMAAAASEDRPASQVMRELMRAYIEKCRQAGAYDAYLQDKVAVARVSVQAGRGRANDDVEAAFSARRNKAAAGRA